ncbi:E3 ubiquitin ligase PARAQUAT TOLERANCE 3-like isoform X2 [Telopea speciosissima]|uniref:E3 ubiquitin ligase PARAQUAT TOLERANCE 3-like isoform X2 n=1 Tax=Telopea speciosissima TaxID=54955 RepID=UPI001CC7D62B|nr:E3 ubiquitin ligase PARAQUAT TOLERANCE 3-like isoform X2 [Telopea speciosissima]
MAVYYKFKSAKDYDSISIDGHFISVANLKEKIFESKHLGRGTDFDLMVSNAQTNEEYCDEDTLIPKNTSVLIRRVPGRPRMPIVAEQDESKVLENKVEDAQPAKSSYPVPDSSVTRFPEESEWDEFGNDLYAIPEVLPVQSSNPVQDAPPPSKADEDSKIRALIDTPALDWQRQPQDGFGSGRGFGRGMGGRMMGGRGFGRAGGLERGLERKTPPVGYICHRCKVPGHFIQHCPTNGDPNYDIKRVKPPTGIPKSMLMTTPDGSYALPSGAVAVLKPNEAAFEKEIEGLPSTRSVSELPPELRCPLCKEVMKDAVLTSKCCFKSFCDKCIRDHIISKSICVCGATNILADDLLPNKTLRDTINRILESNNSSAENAGSMLQIQDMESARSAQPKVPSPTFSATSKGEHVQPPSKDVTPDLKDTTNEKKPTMSAPQPSVEKVRIAKPMDFSEATRESASVKEATSQCSAPLPEEEVQQKLQAGELVRKKKKKKARLPLNAADMQWRSSQDIAPENYMMPLGPSAYNPYWAGMQLGMDGYAAPYSGAIPYMGYAPGPFDVPFGGIVPQDPFVGNQGFGGQGFMLPVVPPQRDLSELAMGTYPVPPVMSREEFEARKADLRRKREIDRQRESRERSKELDGGREVSSSGGVSSMKSKPRPVSHVGSADYAHHQRIESERASSRERFSRESESTRHGKKRAEHPPRHDDDYHDHHHRHEQQHHHRHHKDDDDTRTASAVEAAPKVGGAAAAAAAAAERKLKGSVFSRISFPEEGGTKKRKVSSSTEESKEVVANGYNDLEPSPSSHNRPSSNGYRDEWKPPVKGTAAVSSSAGSTGAGVVGRRKSMVDHDSSDDERHFKRRPSRYEPPPPPPDEWEEEARPSRSSRERERERDRDRGRDHERERGYSSKHR